MKEYNYTLIDGFEYHHKGEVRQAEFIKLIAPTARYITDIAPVKSQLTKAIQWAQTQDGVEAEDIDTVEDQDSEVSIDALMTTLDLAPGVEVEKILLHVNSMLTNGIATVEGETKYTNPISQTLSIKDTYGLAGFFLVNFILPSL